MNIIKIGDTQLKLKTKDNKYIITYVNEYDEQLDTLLDTIFKELTQYYNKGLNYDKVCDANAKFICQNLKIEKNLKLGKIIITDWIRPIKEENIKNITKVYGSTTLRIGGAAYHALAYLEVFIEEKYYYVAIESTVSTPYKLQFFVGNDESKFESLIKTCFQCNSFRVSFECDTLWYNIAYPKTGGKRKSRRNRKTKKGKRSRKARKSRRKSKRRRGRR